MTLTLAVDAVLLDSDGVLVDSHAQVDEAWSTLTDEYGLDFGELRAALVGVPARQTLGERLGPDVLDEACARLEDLEVATAIGTQPIAGALRLTGALPADRLAFVTSATLRLAEARWAAAGIAAPPHVVTADDVTVGKPDPEPFLAAAARLGVDPGRCVVFEDSDAGGRAAEAAGATVIAVGSHAWTTRPAARIPDLLDVEIGQGADGFALTLSIRRTA